MALDFIQLKETLESLNLSLGAGKVFFVSPSTDAWSSDLIGLQKVSGQVHGSIQAGLDACTSGRGDTVVVLPGTYTHASATLSMSKNSVTLLGLSGQREATAIVTGTLADPAAGTGFPTVTVTGTNCTIKGLTMSNGWYTSGPVPSEFILQVDGSGASVDDCLFTYFANEGSSHSGVSVKASYVTVKNCRFDNCVMGGAAIFLDPTGGDLRNPVIEGCHFTGVNKDSDSNTAIEATASDANSIYGLLIKGNVFDPTGTGGTYGNDEWYDLDNGGGGDYEGMMCDNLFGVANISYNNQLGSRLSTGIHFIGNKGLNGLSTATPAAP